MAGTGLLLGALLLIAVLNAVTVWYFARSDRAASFREEFAPDVDADAPRDRPPAESPAPPLRPGDAETLTCRQCGTENLAGYQYCRWCVSALSAGTDAAAADTDAPDGRAF
jgi:hypothetical protein